MFTLQNVFSSGKKKGHFLFESQLYKNHLFKNTMNETVKCNIIYTEVHIFLSVYGVHACMHEHAHTQHTHTQHTHTHNTHNTHTHTLWVKFLSRFDQPY